MGDIIEEGTQKKGLQIEYVNIYDIKPNPRNPRVHPSEAIDKLVKSITRFGWTNPIIVSNENIILAGHARLKAAKAANMKEVPILRVDIGGNEAELYTIADNKLQEETFWDEEMLSNILEELNEDMELSDFQDIGFTSEDLDILLGEFEDDQDRIRDEFPEMNHDNLEEDYVCPKCGYSWSGKPKPD